MDYLVAWTFGISLLALAEVFGRATPNQPEDKLYPYARYLKHHDKTRWILKGIAAAIMGLIAEWYAFTLLLPAIESGPLSAAVIGVQTLVGAGLGLSIGKALVEIDYSFYDN